jgi:hypothetical protein
MNEEEFDALMKSRRFGTEDVVHWEGELLANTGLSMTLGDRLWGKTSEDAQRQLLAPYPKLPEAFELADFRKLLQFTAKMAPAVSAIQRMRSSASPSTHPTATVFVRSQGFTLWEARCEIVRRAIEYLENR